MSEKSSIRRSVPKGSYLKNAAKLAAIIVAVLAIWIYPTADPIRKSPIRGIGKSIALEPASHVTGVEALELGNKASSARYTAAAAAYFEANPELTLARSYYPDVSKSSRLERSIAASSARYTAAAAAYLAENPELSLVRSFKFNLAK